MATEEISNFPQRSAPPGPIDIAIVNDDLGTLTLHKIILRRLYTNITVHIINDAKKFHALIQKQPIHLLILDDVITGIHVQDLVRQLRDDAAWDNVPILVETTWSKPDLIMGYLEAGVDGIISFPIFPRKLVSVLSPFINRPNGLP